MIGLREHSTRPLAIDRHFAPASARRAETKRNRGQIRDLDTTQPHYPRKAGFSHSSEPIRASGTLEHLREHLRLWKELERARALDQALRKRETR
jgi:hypothetical protein